LRENIQLTFDLAKIEDIMCLNCGTIDNKVWNKNSGACPKCGGEMTHSVNGVIKVDYEKK
jgi:rRNA maturation endonuclease Nob1